MTPRNVFNEIIKEHFDLTDKYTRQYIVSLEEGEQEQLLAALTSDLYDNIVNKVDEIDFGTIPKSRGDIAKVEKFNMTVQSLDIIRKLCIEYKQDPKPVDIITSAIANIKDHKNIFIKGYSLNVELPMLMYNLMTLCTVRATSMIIATCVEYVSNPANGTMKQALDKVAYKQTQEDVMFKQLALFNSMCKDGSFVKIMNHVIKNAGKLKEDAEFIPTVDNIDSLQQTDPGEPDSQIPAESPFVGEEPEPCDGDECDEPPVDPYPQEPVPQDPAEVMDDIDPEEEPSNGHIDWFHRDSDDTDSINPNPYTDPDIEDIDGPIIEDEMTPDEIFGDKVPNAPARAADKIASKVGGAIVDRIFGGDEENKSNAAGSEAPVDEAKIPFKNLANKGVAAGKNHQRKQFEKDTGKPFKDATKQEIEDWYAAKREKSLSNKLNKKKEVTNEGVGEAIGSVFAGLPVGGKVAAVAGIVISAIAVYGISKQLILKVVIPGLRNTIYTFYYTAFKISDYWKMQADFLDANADELENSTDMDPDKKNKIIAKQRKWAETFRKWANKFNLDKKAAEAATKKNTEEDAKNKKKVGQDSDGYDVLF